MRTGSSGTHSHAMRTRGSTPLEEGMTGLADSQVMGELHHRESNRIAVSLLWKPLQQDAAASVGQPGVTR
jgi:hypothetical protein